MADLRIIDRRGEERIPSDVTLLVWGVDTRGERFTQQALARDLSNGGALLSGLECDLRSGDVRILYAGRKARFRVVWVREAGPAAKLQAAVQRFSCDLCPWQELLQDSVPASPHK
jgi:hypothetical protein